MTSIDRIRGMARDVRNALSGTRARGSVQACAVAAGLGTLLLIPVFTQARAAGSQPSTTGLRAAVTSKHAAARRSSASRQGATTVRIALTVTKASASVGTLETIAQTLNNCGPSSVAAVLAYWHVYRSEAQVAAVLRADNSYWGMSPVDLPTYVRSLGLRALVGYAGTEKLVKGLISNGFPVIASQYVSSTDAIRHYRPIEAYSDRTGVFVSADPYLGAGHVISYGEFNSIWAESGYRFQVVYPPSRQSRLDAVLRAAGWNKSQAYSYAVSWEEQQMQTSAFLMSGSWIWYNGYADVAFDEAQLGQYAKAQTALTAAARQGISLVLIGWVRNEIQSLEHHR